MSVCCYLRDPTFSRSDTIPECDRHTHTHTHTHTHRQTLDDGTYRASTASRDKKNVVQDYQPHLRSTINHTRVTTVCDSDCIL